MRKICSLSLSLFGGGGGSGANVTATGAAVVAGIFDGERLALVV